jgi:uncharacterized membrane protein YfcA
MHLQREIYVLSLVATIRITATAPNSVQRLLDVSELKLFIYSSISNYIARYFIKTLFELLEIRRPHALYIAIPIAIRHALSGAIGARLAIVKGNKFIRIFFLIVVTGTIIRFAYDVFFR